MMAHVWIADIGKHVGEEVTLKGWLYNKRSSKKLVFLQLRDGTGIVQCVVFRPDLGDEIYDICDKMPQETSLSLTGTVSKDDRSEIGYELQVKKVEIAAYPTQEYPITPKEHGVAFLMDYRYLWLRSKRQNAIMRVRHELIMAIRDYFDINGFTNLDAPIFTPNACEGTTNLFEVGYFDTKAYLTQSGQLYMEAGAAALGKVYCFGPTFRAEKSKTRRHLTEFWMIEPEVAFIDLDGDMDLMEDFVCYIVKRVLEKCRRELEILERDVTALEKIKKPFPRLTYDEAYARLKELGSDFEYGTDFGGDDETMLTQSFEVPIMVHRWPREIKAFYMKRDPKDPTKAMGVDMLAPEGYGEIIGGGQREDDYEELLKQIDKEGLPHEPFEWYLDLRRYGTFTHSGFGLGLERTLAWITGIKHVREAIPFPRMMERLSP